MKRPSGISVCYAELICYNFMMLDNLNTIRRITEEASSEIAGIYPNAALVKNDRGPKL